MVCSRPAVMSQAYQRFTARGAFLLLPGSGRMTCSGCAPAPVDGDVEDAPGLGHPLVPLFSPVPRRFRSYGPAARGPWRGGGAPRGASPRPCRPPRSPAAAGPPAGSPRSREQHPGPGSGPGRTAPRPPAARGGDLLQLPLANADPGRGQHQLARLLIRARPAEHLHQALQRPGIPARRQVQHPVTREQRPRALGPGPVGDPPHAHLAQRCHHRPAMTALRASPRHPIRAGHPRQPHLRSSLPVQAELQHTTQDLPPLLAGQQLHVLQRHRLPRLHSEPGQHDRHRPQPRHHRIRASRQRIQPVLFHPRLPFRRSRFRTSGPYGTEASPTPSRAATTTTPAAHSKRATPC